MLIVKGGRTFPTALVLCLFLTYPSGKTADKKGCAHSDNEDYNDTNNKVFDHIAGIDFFLVLVSDRNLNTYVCAPNHHNGGKRNYNIDPKLIHKGFEVIDNLREIIVKARFCK